jgi:UDPglucose 6-dehydrogenase
VASPLHITVLGLWHLGSVTAACLARHHRVTGLDFDASALAGLKAGRAPLHEPGLDQRLAEGLVAGRLDFSADAASVAAADVLWVCYDTPVDADDRSDADWVLTRVDRALPHLRAGTVVLLSSQLPSGTCARLAAAHPALLFACSPENLRLGKAIEAFEQPARIIVGAPADARPVLERLFAPLGAPLVWMRPESAEMVKHALNGFLALSVAYINEVATLCEAAGADAQEVAAGLKSDPRIGARAYLAPGGPFAGGTLARDVVTLARLGAERQLPLSLIPAIKESNDRHREWAFRRVQAALAGVAVPVVAVLGLTYTPNTSTLRRSAAVELCRRLAAAGVTVRAFDPLVRTPDADHADLRLAAEPAEALQGAHALVVCTEWPEFRDYPWRDLLARMARPVVVDANRQLEKVVAGAPGLLYITVGRP